MPFVVKHTPVGGLVETAARAAGARQQAARESQAAAMRRQQEAQAASFQRQQMAIAASQQQAQQAQAAATARQERDLQFKLSRAQASDEFKQQEISMRATALQDASAARNARTPRSRTEGMSPVARDIKARLEALNKLKERGGVSDAEFRRSSQEIVTGRRAPTARVPKGPSASEKQRDDKAWIKAVNTAETLQRQMNRKDISSSQRQRYATQLVKLHGQATEQWGDDWKSEEDRPFRMPSELVKGSEPKPDLRDVPWMPMDQTKIVPGVIGLIRSGKFKGRPGYLNPKTGRIVVVG